jgi:aminopeptidase N
MADFDPQEVIRVATHAINFLQDYFACEYPAKKSDFVFWPGHNWLGLSSHGVMSFSENLIPREMA